MSYYDIPCEVLSTSFLTKIGGKYIDTYVCMVNITCDIYNNIL